MAQKDETGLRDNKESGDLHIDKSIRFPRSRASAVQFLSSLRGSSSSGRLLDGWPLIDGRSVFITFQTFRNRENLLGASVVAWWVLRHKGGGA